MEGSMKHHLKFNVHSIFLWGLVISFLTLSISCAYINLEGLDGFEREITSFVFRLADNADALAFDIPGNINSDTVEITVPYGTNLLLTPTITFLGKTLYPGNGQARAFVDGVGVPYTVQAEDDSEKEYLVTVKYTTPEAIPPAQVTVTNVTEGDGQVTLEWTDPGDADFDHVEISWTPSGTGTYSVSKGTQTYTAGGLTNGTEYSFSIVSVDEVSNKSVGVTIKAVPDAVISVSNYCIYTADDLNAVRGGLKTGWDKTKSYIVMADIDLSGYSPWTPLGTSADPFSGNFNGNGYNITGLYINTTADYQGLFGYISGSSIIKNVRVVNCDITGGKNVGGLAGYFMPSGAQAFRASIMDCHVSGNIGTVIPNTGVYLGGLVGWLGSGGANNPVTRCSVNATISVSSSTAMHVFIGGLIGRQESSWIITECFTTGSFVDTDNSAYIGGLVSSSNGTIRNCFSRMDVTGSTYIGGLVANSTGMIDKCYTTGDITQGGSGTTNFGGLAGTHNSTADTSYYCGTLIGTISDNAYGIRKTGPEMKLESTFSGWDFINTWDIDPAVNNGFPCLRENRPE